MLVSDQLHRKIHIPTPPRRIISLVPSITELLFDLGLDAQIIGVTRFCIFPATAKKEKTIIGGTKNLKIDRIRALKPDLIIADKEENTKEQIEILAEAFPVWISNIRHFDDALDMIQKVGRITRTSSLAQKLISQIEVAFSKKEQVSSAPSVAYLIWKEPIMVAASDTFIHEMLKKAGFTNAFADQSRYPEVSPEALQSSRANLIFLSSEPYPFSEKHIQYFKDLMPNTQVILVDGTYFSWYGSRILPAAAYFSSLQLNFGN